MCKVPPLEPRPATIVVGFSVRALAEATRAAIGPPLAVDYFADHDCRRVARRVVRLTQWGGNVLNPEELIRELAIAGATPQSLVLLAGGMENWPELVELLHQHFTVLGPQANQLHQLRSPARWQLWAQQAELAFPQTHFTETEWEDPPQQDPAQPGYLRKSPQQHDSWLVKPLRGAGGYSIRWSAAQTGQDALISRSPGAVATYRQRHVVGRGLGAYCVLRSDGRPLLLGASVSLSAADWPGPSEFIYRGSLGPIDLPTHHRRQIIDLCQLIQRETGMLGWLQLDFIEDPAGRLWLLELNPRWAAGMEVLFLAGLNPVEHHCRVWRSASAVADATQHRSNSGDFSVSNSGDVEPPSTAAVWSPAVLLREPAENSFGKAVVYAPRELQLTHRRIESLHSLPRENFADLPSQHLIRDGQTAHLVSVGEPLLTVRARGPRDNLLEQLSRLREAALAALAGI